MSSRTCCVPGCAVNAKEGVLHKFPNPEFESDRFQIWISNIGSPVAELDKNYVFATRRVCRKHFEQVYYYGNNRLCRLSVPTLFMPAQSNGLVHTYIPSPLRTPALCDIRSCNQTDRQRQTTEFISLNTDNKFSEVNEIEEVSHPFYNESPASLNQGEITMTKEEQLKNTITKLKAKLNRSNKVNMLLKKKLKRVKQQAARNIPFKTFLQMEITQAEKKSKGRQFSLNENVLALSLHNANRKTYGLLRNKYILPHKRILELLQKNTYKLVNDDEIKMNVK